MQLFLKARSVCRTSSRILSMTGHVCTNAIYIQQVNARSRCISAAQLPATCHYLSDCSSLRFPSGNQPFGRTSSFPTPRRSRLVWYCAERRGSTPCLVAGTSCRYYYIDVARFKLHLTIVSMFVDLLSGGELHACTQWFDSPPYSYLIYHLQKC